MIEQSQQSPSKNYLFAQIRGFVSQVINFGISQHVSDEFIKISLNLKLGKFIQVRYWNMSIQAQIKSFVGKVKLVIKNKCTMTEVFRKNAQDKIMQSSKQFCNVIQKIIQKQNWCLCGRKVCPARFQRQRMMEKIKDFFTIQFIRQMLDQQDYIRDEDDSNFLSIVNDMQCCILSIEKTQKKLQLKRTEKKKDIKQIKEIRQPNPEKIQSILQFLGTMKINKNQRRSCNIDFQKMDKLYLKYKNKF